MIYRNRWRGMIAAWLITVIGVSSISSWNIEYPEALSMSPFVTSLISVSLFWGIPLALGLVAVQGPAFYRSIASRGSLFKACLISAGANTLYAAMLSVPLALGSWFFGTEVTAVKMAGVIGVLVVCSFGTSVIWLASNEIFSKVRNA